MQAQGEHANLDYTTIWLSGDCILAIAVNISGCLSLCWPYDRLAAYARCKPALIQ